MPMHRWMQSAAGARGRWFAPVLGTELFDRLMDHRIEAGAAGIEMGEDRSAHARVPESRDVLGDARLRLVGTLAREELADLVGHVDELVRRHGRSAPSRHDADA